MSYNWLHAGYMVEYMLHLLYLIHQGWDRHCALIDAKVLCPEVEGCGVNNNAVQDTATCFRSLFVAAISLVDL